MGCDIHTYRERFINGSWHSADKWTPYDYGDDDKGVAVEYGDRAYTRRNYDLFGLIAKGVRRDFQSSIKTRGIAFDSCQEYLAEVKRWGVDGHSHSYLYLHELQSLRKWVDGNTIPISGMMNKEQLERLKKEMAAPKPSYDSLYPYCQWTSDRTQVEFSIELPMSFIVADCLKQVIASFDGIDGENHRLVFFFDN